MRRRMLASLAKSGFDFSKYAGFSDAVLFWDAIHNDGIGKPHNPNRTSSVKDLVGNNDAVFARFDPAAKIEVMNDRIDIASGAMLNCETNFDVTELLNSDFSVEIVFEDTGNTYIDSAWFDIGTASGTIRGLRPTGFGNGVTPQVLGAFEYRLNAYNIVGLGSTKRGLSHCITSLQDSTSNKIMMFLDGAYVGTSGGGNVRSGFLDLVRIAMSSHKTTGETKPMRLMRFGIINGLLTESEIAANYAIDKARFNLPDAA